MEQPLKYITQGESSKIGLLTTFDFVSCTADPIVLTKKIEDNLVIFAIYVDDILVTRSDEVDISTTKAYLQQHLSIRDLETLWYFFEIVFAYQDEKLTLTQ
ncbi:unnamed protein product [Spirodela intermedia]|uniref:Reverse transcriptase Ty1/copia-type domain-containing protein n=1 Tax=Spirodela intermedia TaxID=51605 RepID=A0ABN7ECT7_SPIIN|nr:unnamed protein product [Spirodela intermedia]